MMCRFKTKEQLEASGWLMTNGTTDVVMVSPDHQQWILVSICGTPIDLDQCYYHHSGRYISSAGQFTWDALRPYTDNVSATPSPATQAKWLEWMIEQSELERFMVPNISELEPPPRKCICDITLIMRSGCQCGGV